MSQQGDLSLRQYENFCAVHGLLVKVCFYIHAVWSDPLLPAWDKFKSWIIQRAS